MSFSNLSFSGAIFLLCFREAGRINYQPINCCWVEVALNRLMPKYPTVGRSSQRCCFVGDFCLVAWCSRWNHGSLWANKKWLLFVCLNNWISRFLEVWWRTSFFFGLWILDHEKTWYLKKVLGCRTMDRNQKTDGILWIYPTHPVTVTSKITTCLDFFRRYIIII